MSYYLEPDSHIRDKVKVVKDLSNYATKEELEHATGIDTSDLAAKKYFFALKTDIDKQEINKLVNGLVTTTVLNKKTSEGENKIPNTSTLVTTTVLNIKNREDENEIPDHAKYITTPEFN